MKYQTQAPMSLIALFDSRRLHGEGQLSSAGHPYLCLSSCREPQREERHNVQFDHWRVLEQRQVVKLSEFRSAAGLTEASANTACPRFLCAAVGPVRVQRQRWTLPKSIADQKSDCWAHCPPSLLTLFLETVCDLLKHSDPPNINYC